MNGSSAGDDTADILRPPRTFDAACRMVLDYLTESLPMGLWAVTRVVEDQQVMIAATDTAYGFAGPGVVLDWPSSMCRPMVEGRTPRIARDVSLVPEYAATAAGVAPLRIGGYIGTPIMAPDGGLFGTVCGFDPGRLDESDVDQQPLLDVFSALLSAVLAGDLAATEQARATERALVQADTDALTGLMNRRGWDRFLTSEEARFVRFGEPAHVVVLDLDLLKRVNDTRGHAAGDRYISAAADALRAASRADDALARSGGDEFAMVIRAGRAEAQGLVRRMEQALEDAGVLGSFGSAPFSVVAGFPGTIEAADAAMYEDKRARRAARGTQL